MVNGEGEFMPRRIGKCAVVIGAGMGGLAAARVLADWFDQVIVLERDEFQADSSQRPGTPQARHLHGLLMGGLNVLAELFPGFTDTLAAAGAVMMRAGLDVRIERPGYDPFPRRNLGFASYSMSRPLLEGVVRKHVSALQNITIRQNCRVKEFLISEDKARVTAVRFNNSQGEMETIQSDLVIDSSGGRGTLTLELLEANGYSLPEKTVIGVDIGYSTAIFSVPDDASYDWKGIMAFPEMPYSSRGAYLQLIEENRWIVSISERHKDGLPSDLDGFLAFAKTLRTPTIFNAIRNATQVSDVVRYALPEIYWRHFERLSAFPAGLLPMGDVICRFNPVWAQGMSVALREAQALGKLLEKSAELEDPFGNLARMYFEEARKVIEVPWEMAAIPDFILPETRGERPADFMNKLKFSGAVNRLAAIDPAVHKLTVEIQHLIRPQSMLYEPDVFNRAMELMV